MINISIKQQKWYLKVAVLLVLLLFVNLPVVSALEISNVHVEQITDTSAVVNWETTEPADSFVNYGSFKSELKSIGDASLVEKHEVPLSNLQPQATYYYSIKSNDYVDNNSGNLYSFTTLEPDIIPPKLVVDIPSFVKGSKLDISGQTEIGAMVNIYVGGSLMGTTTAVSKLSEMVLVSRSIGLAKEVGKEAKNGEEAVAGSAVKTPEGQTEEQTKKSTGELEGGFAFSNIVLAPNKESKVKIEALDKAGNGASVEAVVFADTSKPKVKLESIPQFVGSKTLELKGTISEKSSYEIFLNNRSVAKGESNTIQEKIQLQEGKNEIKVVVIDTAGWEDIQTISVEADTSPPTVKAEIERGMEYYEGRAESDIHGTTEPGATVYLYVYRPLGYEFNPDFKKARKKVTANEQGEFTFEDVKFSQEVFDLTLEDLAPKEVPSGLQKYTIFPVEQVAAQQRFTYYVFIIAEDRVGKSGFWQKTVNVHTCFSANLDFGIDSISKFQAPLRLVPQLLDDGRQEIQAVFQFNYLGEGLPKIIDGKEIDKGAKITNVQFEKACTKTMLEEDKFGIGCKLLPTTENHQTMSGDKSAVYVTWNLHSSEEFSARKEDFWNEFKKRQVVFPLKVRISYQERIGEDRYGPTKIQTSCYDLSYSVDIPVESKEMIPDFLAEEGVDALDWTIEQIQTVRPYLEKAYLITGISCMASWLLRSVTRWGRIFTSRVEHYTTIIKLGKDKNDPKGEGCPNFLNQNGLYMQDTLDNWEKLPRDKLPTKVAEALGDSDKRKLITLEERCPSTASAWKFEAALNKVYQWSCDRSFCREVPAGWTEDKTTDKIGEVIIRQQQCAITGKGIPLLKRENCQELVKTNPINLPTHVSINEINVCWQTSDGTLYHYIQPTGDTEKGTTEVEQSKAGVYYLTPVGRIMGDLAPSKERLIAYKFSGAEGYVVGKDQTCEQVCKNPRKPNFKADIEGSVDGKGCYVEKVDVDGQLKFFGKGDTKLTGNKYPAGYTKNCFVDVTTPKPEFKQCVCIGKKEEGEVFAGARIALPKEGEIEEEWFYHQERVFKESNGLGGTYYPPERYYSGRDFSGAFGQDYLLDYFRSEENKEVPSINPHTQFIGMFQSVCLSAILKNMRMLESILVGLRNCLIEAKYTGLQDAGMCKTMFTQHVCGLIYKAIGYLTSNCHSVNIDDVGKGGTFGDVGVFVSEGFESMDMAVESSIDDIKDDYGNAALNEYFKGGTQGFAQSMCLAAFGYEFPLFSEEFLLEAAYATPMKTSVIIAPKERELSTYNPARQTAIFNYNIGGIILPGCRIRNWKISLKCIGPEDQGRPGVDTSCGGKGCDCLNAQGIGSPLEGEKEKLLMTGFALSSGQMFSIPLESPQRVDTHYRYDHVKLELILDPSEKGNEDKCFDEGYYEGMKGIFFEPIIDVSPPFELSCRADITTGRYFCPELSGMFGFGGSSLEEPYVSCWNKDTESWTDCKTPNLFTINNEIKVRAHVNLDDKGKCLRRTISPALLGVTSGPLIRTLPENVPGPLFVEDNLGTVQSGVFSGSYSTIQLVPSASNSKCQGLAPLNTPETVSSAGQYTFVFVPVADGKVRLTLPPGAIVESADYSKSGDLLARGSETSLTVEQINEVIFSLGGLKVKNVLAGLSASEQSIKQCTYQVASAGGGGGANVRSLHVTYELLERDEGGSCAFARQPVKTATGKSSWTETISLQREVTAFGEGGMHASFMAKNYDQTLTMVKEEMNKKNNNLDNAVAIYYGVASLIAKGKGTDAYNTQIQNLLRAFFERFWMEQLADYPDDVTLSTEYLKIKQYLCEVTGKISYDNPKKAGMCP